MTKFRVSVCVFGLCLLVSCSLFGSEGPGAHVEYRLEEIRFRFTENDRLCVTPGFGDIVTDPDDFSASINADRIVFEDVDGSELVIRGAGLAVERSLTFRIDHAPEDRPEHEGDARQEAEDSYEFWAGWAQRHDGTAENVGMVGLPTVAPPIFDKRRWAYRGNFLGFPDNGVVGVGVSLKPFPEKLITLVRFGSSFATVDDDGGPYVRRPFLEGPELFCPESIDGWPPVR